MTNPPASLPPTWPANAPLNRTTPRVDRPYPGIGLGTALFLGVIFCYLAFLLRAVLIPFALSFALAYLANPLVDLFEARGLRRTHIVIVLYIVIAIVVTTAANLLLPMITTELAMLQGRAPQYFSRSRDYLIHLQGQIARHTPVGQDFIQRWSLQMYTPLVNYLEHLPGYILGLVPFLSLLFLVPFITFYLLTDSERLLQNAIQTCPSRHVEKVLHLLTEIDASLGNYVRGILIEALCVAIGSFVGLMILNVDYALAIATLAGVASFVPYAGPILGATVGGLVALFQFGEIWMAAKVILMFVIIRLADDMLLQPMIARYSVRLHPLIYLLALMAGGEAFGFVGLLFGVPIACAFKALFRVAWDWYSTETQRHRLPAFPVARIPYV